MFQEVDYSVYEFVEYEGDYERIDEGKGSFKEVYVDRQDEELVYVPKWGDGVDLVDNDAATIASRLHRVLTWKHNTEVLAANGVELGSTWYEAGITRARRGREIEPVSVLRAEYNPDLRLGSEMTAEEREACEETLQQYGDVLEELRERGEIAIAVNDTSINTKMDRDDFAYSEERGVVLLDVGEVNDVGVIDEVTGGLGGWEFLERHGIDAEARCRARQYLASCERLQ